MADELRLPERCRSLVAIPACNEEARIGATLAALSVQRDSSGAPLQKNRFAVLVLANNCNDATAEEARRWGALCSFPILVLEQALPPAQANAGGARKAAMDLAADLLESSGLDDGVIFTTDADSSVCSTWTDRTLAEIASGADAVAGYIEAHATELVGLGSAFTHRGRLEDRYLACMAEILALSDPLPHDPWPNHRVASGASFALTLRAYRAIGGLPPRSLGEDVALAEALLVADFKLRHSLEVVVTTSCRLDGRASGGAADTMRLRRDDPDATCDVDMEAAVPMIRRLVWKGRLRAWYNRGRQDTPFETRIGLAAKTWTALVEKRSTFERFWRAVEAQSPLLRRTPPLRPSQLPNEIAKARRAIRLLRRRADLIRDDDR